MSYKKTRSTIKRQGNETIERALSPPQQRKLDIVESLTGSRVKYSLGNSSIELPIRLAKSNLFKINSSFTLINYFN
jgi:hypothetical protein